MSKKMNYCKKCILPDSRPNLIIDEDGICNACRGTDYKVDINWEERHEQLLEIFDKVKKNNTGYDCIIPVSGGKDSTWQVMKCKEYGLNVLAITWRTPGRTEIGQHNLDNLIALGVDHIDFTINPEVEKKFMKKSFLETGSSAVPMHLSIYTIPLKFAVDLNIPLIIWGESPYMEYGGDLENNNKLDVKWMKEHGILQGKLATDWIDEDLTRKEIQSYILPDDEKIEKTNVQSIFLGYYLKWDPEISLKSSLESGFRVREEGPKVGFYNYADIDCDFISIHHYFKWMKFGFTRLFDNLSLEIRNGRINRDEALKIVEEMGSQEPKEDIEKYCRFVGLSIEEFYEVAERYRNTDIWKQVDGVWKIDDFIIQNWKWE
jgi:N-acetyl sugar amidotransferase